MNSWTVEVPGTLVGEKVEELALAGTRCEKCGRVYFPARRNCPRCLDEQSVQQITLSTQGTLQSFSVSKVAPPGFSVPHAQGYVDLADNGPRIFSLLTDHADGANLKAGCKMALKIVELGKDKEEKPIVAYRFRPL